LLHGNVSDRPLANRDPSSSEEIESAISDRSSVISRQNKETVIAEQCSVTDHREPNHCPIRNPKSAAPLLIRHSPQPFGIFFCCAALTAAGMEARQGLQNIRVVGVAAKRFLQPRNCRFDLSR
jgi:hypothetical protein